MQRHKMQFCLGGDLSDAVKQKMTKLKTNHPELGALADRMQTMNVTEVTSELAALLDFGQTMMGAVKNLQGNMSSTEAQNATLPRVGEHLSDTLKQKMTNIKTDIRAWCIG